MSKDSVNLTIDSRGVAILQLNRPQRHNAFDDVMIDELLKILYSVETNESVRLVILRAAGKSFSAGADLDWMHRMAGYDRQKNYSDALQLAELMDKLNRLNKPLIGLVHGAAFGGGVGLVACCDIAIAAESATFCLSEVKLGLIPAVISPYVVAAIGARETRRYALSAEKFNAAEARRLGLVHEVTEDVLIQQRLEKLVDDMLSCGPRAQVEAKQLIQTVSQYPLDSMQIEQTAETISRIRASIEGREGLSAFLQKRKPAWMKD